MKRKATESWTGVIPAWSGPRGSIVLEVPKEPEEIDVSNDRFSGHIKKILGKKAFIESKALEEATGGYDAKIVEGLSGPCPELAPGLHVTFSVTEDPQGEGYLAIDVESSEDNPRTAISNVSSKVPGLGRAQAAFCTSCGKAFAPGDSFCSSCGARRSGGPATSLSRPATSLSRPATSLLRQSTPQWSRAKLARPARSFTRVFLEKTETAAKEELELTRESLEVRIDGSKGSEVQPISAFSDLTGVLPEFVEEALAEAQFEEPMPVQAQGLPVILSGLDTVGIAKTGSGKTLAYMLPAIVHIEAQEPLARGASSPIALVLAPTRELAVQIGEEAQRLCKFSSRGSHGPRGIGTGVVYGGTRKWDQLNSVKGCHVVCATPGRLVDFLTDGEISLDRVTYFVLDEADRMLECGFASQVGQINEAVRPDRHMLFFSATWPDEVQQLATEMCQKGSTPVHLLVGQRAEGGPATREDIVQEVVVFDEETWEERDASKQQALYAHLREVMESPDHKVLVFVSRKELAESLANQLWEENFHTDAMHGGKKQETRMGILDKFKRGETQLLVCTDVMSRGLDIPDISHVVMYDMGEVEDYVHRIGRTARGPYGQGHALTFFEYDRKWPHLAAELVEVIEQSGQEVPEELQTLVEQVASGERDSAGHKHSKYEPKADTRSSWGNAGSGKTEAWNQQRWKKGESQFVEKPSWKLRNGKWA